MESLFFGMDRYQAIQIKLWESQGLPFDRIYCNYEELYRNRKRSGHHGKGKNLVEIASHVFDYLNESYKTSV